MLRLRNMNIGCHIGCLREAVPVRRGRVGAASHGATEGIRAVGGGRWRAAAYPPIHPNRHDSRRVAASNACARSLSGPRGKPRDEPMIAITSRMLPV